LGTGLNIDKLEIYYNGIVEGCMALYTALFFCSTVESNCYDLQNRLKAILSYDNTDLDQFDDVNNLQTDKLSAFNENAAKCNYTNSAFSQIGSYFKDYKYVQDHSLCFKNGPYVHEIVSSDQKKLIDMNLDLNDTTETS